MTTLPKILVAVGTRPEAIKLGPVIKALKESGDIQTLVVTTGQHNDMLQRILKVFDITPDIDLGIMEHQQSLNQIISRITMKMDVAIADLAPDIFLVQGDTSSAFASALVAYYCKIPVFHVEAGLRTHNLYSPYPEEGNRKLISTITSVHLAPTLTAKKNLLTEGIPEDTIYVTGNPVIDAIKKMEKFASVNIKRFINDLSEGNNKIILVTSHRRESWGQPLRNICDAINEISSLRSDVEFVFPLHMNPRVRATVKSILEPNRRVHLLEPLDYPDTLYTLKNSTLTMTDSGGIQEEATYYNVPLVILRDHTERPEIIYQNRGVLAGRNRKRIVEEVMKILDTEKRFRCFDMPNPFGDGHASRRIRLAIERFSRGVAPLLEAEEQFSSPDFSRRTGKTETNMKLKLNL